jgi:four helix bundle protein
VRAEIEQVSGFGLRRNRVQDFTKLRVWADSHQLALDVIASLPASRYRSIPGLRAQAIRAAMAVPTNVAEGCGKTSPLELARYAEIACGSVSELQAHLRLACDGGIMSAERYKELSASAEIVRRMLVALARSVRARSGPTVSHTPHR